MIMLPCTLSFLGRMLVCCSIVVSVIHFTSLVRTEISQHLEDGFMLHFGTHGTWSPNNFVAPLTFQLVPPAGRSFHLCNILTSNQLVCTKGCSDIHTSQTINATDFVSPLTLPFFLPWSWYLWFWVKCFHNYWVDWHAIQYRYTPFRMNCYNICHFLTAITPSSGTGFRKILTIASIELVSLQVDM